LGEEGRYIHVHTSAQFKYPPKFYDVTFSCHLQFMDAEDTEECQPQSSQNFITDFLTSLLGKATRKAYGAEKIKLSDMKVD